MFRFKKILIFLILVITTMLLVVGCQEAIKNKSSDTIIIDVLKLNSSYASVVNSKLVCIFAVRSNLANIEDLLHDVQLQNTGVVVQNWRLVKENPVNGGNYFTLMLTVKPITDGTHVIKKITLGFKNNTIIKDIGKITISARTDVKDKDIINTQDIIINSTVINKAGKSYYALVFESMKPVSLNLNEIWGEHDNYYVDKKAVFNKKILLKKDERKELIVPISERKKSKEKLIEFKPLLIYKLIGNNDNNFYAKPLNVHTVFKGWE